MIILNEREYAETCINTGDVGENVYITLQILAKYYYEQGMRTKRIEKALLEFLKENYKRYHANILKWQETVERISRRAGKYPLYDISEILITQAEIDTINSIEESNGRTELKRLAFTILCLAKLANKRNVKNNGWVNEDAKDIFKMAHISASKLKQYQMLGDLGLLGLLEFPKKNDNLSNRVTFVNDDSPYVISIVRCASCGRLIKNNKAKTKKYCSECAGYQTWDTKTIICVDCGKTFDVDAKNNQTNRCNNCYDKYRRNKIRENVQNYRSKSISM